MTPFRFFTFLPNPFQTMISDVDRLLAYSRLESLTSSQRTTAQIAARWLRVEPAATTDPLLSDLWSAVCASESSASSFDSTPFDLLMARSIVNTKPIVKTGSSVSVFTRPKSIADYFTAASGAPSITSSKNTTSPPISPLIIYCDGACSSNGRRGAKAGYGVSVWCTGSGPEDRREIAAVSRALDATEPQTNQRAELRGLAEALKRAVEHGAGADIYTDSQYAMNCLQTWGAGWAAKGWRKADGGPVLHQDILKPMWDLWKRRGPHIQIHHVAAHTGRSDMHSRGNARADELATKSLAAE